MSTTAPPPPHVRRVRHLGPVPAASTSDWSLVGQDGGQSIDLGGDVLFVFADTLLAARGAPADGRTLPWPLRRGEGRFLANSAARAARGRLADELGRLRYYLGPDGWPCEVLCATPAEHLARVRFWPAHGLAVGDRVFLFYLGIEHRTPGAAWGFRNTGTGLSVLEPETGRARRLRWEGDDWRLFPVAGDDTHAGVQVLREGGDVYVFASVRHGLSVTARVARVAVERVADRAAYLYLASDAPAWDPSPARALDLGPCGDDFSVSWNAHLGLYLMCYVEHAGRRLCLRAAPHPWGPYGPPRVVDELPTDAPNPLAALAFEHPLYAEDGGRTLLVSYCQANFGRNQLVGLTLA